MSGPHRGVGVAPGDDPTIIALDEAAARLRAPWAAGAAGLLFAVLFAAALVIVRGSPINTADDAELARLFAEGGDAPVFVASLYLAPFAGIMFLWFVAVIRDQVGDREDRFFATVFLGSGITFVTLLFAATAVVGSLVVGVRFLDLPPPVAADVAMVRALAYTLLFGFATRAASVLLLSIATLGIRSGAFPRWFAWSGYALGAVMLVVVSFWDWILLALPAWVAIVSLFILRRDRRRSGARDPSAAR